MIRTREVTLHQLAALTDALARFRAAANLDSAAREVTSAFSLENVQKIIQNAKTFGQDAGDIREQYKLAMEVHQKIH